jgi:hypothetical protein
MKRKFSTKEMTLLCASLLEMQPRKPGAEDFEVMDNRQYILDALYVIDGRHKPNHKMRGLYTGLFIKYFKA